MSHTRICLVRTGALGDVILTLPAIHTLRQAFPRAAIHLIGNARLLALAEGENIHIHDINRAEWAPMFAPGGTPVQALSDLLSGTDLLISYLPDPDGVFADNLHRLGIRRILTHPPRPADPIHAVDHLLQPLRNLGLSPSATCPKIHLTDADRANLSPDLLPTGPALLIHPGSGGAPKRWPPESFAAVANALSPCVRILIASGPDDGDLARRIADECPSARCLPHLPLRTLAAIMACCTACLGNDSGPSHLSAAIGLPTVALFGPTDPRIWAPRGKTVRIIQAPDKNIASISPDRAIAALRPLLFRTR